MEHAKYWPTIAAEAERKAAVVVTLRRHLLSLRKCKSTTKAKSRQSKTGVLNTTRKRCAMVPMLNTLLKNNEQSKVYLTILTMMERLRNKRGNWQRWNVYGPWATNHQIKETMEMAIQGQ